MIVRVEAETKIELEGILNPPRLICFVCTGNTCRSPMAAAAFNALYKGKAMKAVSCGLRVNRGDVIAENAAAALRSRGIESTPENDYEHHFARQVNERCVSKCERVIAMTAPQALELVSCYPAYASKISAMPDDIPDPYGCALDKYLQALDAILAGLGELFAL